MFKSVSFLFHASLLSFSQLAFFITLTVISSLLSLCSHLFFRLFFLFIPQSFLFIPQCFLLSAVVISLSLSIQQIT